MRRFPLSIFVLRSSPHFIGLKDHRCSFILEKSNSNLILKCVYIYIIRYNYTILTSVSTEHIGEVGSGKEGRKGMRFSRDPPHEDY